jgi:hypothetical protein
VWVKWFRGGGGWDGFKMRVGSVFDGWVYVIGLKVSKSMRNEKRSKGLGKNGRVKGK